MFKIEGETGNEVAAGLHSGSATAGKFRFRIPFVSLDFLGFKKTDWQKWHLGQTLNFC